MSADATSPRRRYVVVGGYGHVGRNLAERLSSRHDIAIAGRRHDAAAAVGETLGCASAAVDAATGAGLESVVGPGDVVVNAASDQPDAALLQGDRRRRGIATDPAGNTVVSLASRSESRTTAQCAAALLEHWPGGPDAHGVHLRSP